MIAGVVGLVLLVGLVVLVVAGLRRLTTRRDGAPLAEGTTRRSFQYLLLYGLLVVSASGLSGLLGRLLERSSLVVEDESSLARSVTFALIGLPLYLALALWSRTRLTTDRQEVRSLGWVVYLTLAALTALAVAMTALYDVLAWVVGIASFDGPALARLVVWGMIWAAHWWVDARLSTEPGLRPHRLVGSLLGLATAASGLTVLLGAALEVLLGLRDESLVGGTGPQMLRGAVLVAVGAPVWLLCWARTSLRATRSSLWLAYVLLAGVGAGLLTALTSLSLVLHTVLVWLLGDPGGDPAAAHFGAVPGVLAAAVVGLVVWWYHQAVLDASAAGGRTEVRRLYTYLMAGIGLLAAATGLTMVLVATVEAVVRGADLVVTGSSTNTLLAALTLLLFGVPVWWLHWRGVERAASASPAEELASPTRRVYLVILIGVGGVAAVVSLLSGVYVLVEDAFAGTLGAESARGARFALGVLVTAGVVAGYHWTVLREDREQRPAPARGPGFVLLVGRPDEGIAAAVGAGTGAQVLVWPRTDGQGQPWSAEEVIAALAGTEGHDVVVLSGPAGLQTVPIDRVGRRP